MGLKAERTYTGTLVLRAAGTQGEAVLETDDGRSLLVRVDGARPFDPAFEPFIGKRVSVRGCEAEDERWWKDMVFLRDMSGIREDRQASASPHPVRRAPAFRR